MPLSRFVHLVTQFEGLHHWPEAPEPEHYLRSPHRHLFVVELDLEVFHHDREVEINAATRWLTALLPTLATQSPDGGQSDPLPTGTGGAPDLGRQSCEQLAAAVADAALDRYGRRRRLRCAVLEDGILGAGVTWQPEPAPTATATA